jgi:hypothetical protein
MTGWFLGVPYMSNLSTDRTVADDALLTDGALRSVRLKGPQLA